MKNIIKLGSILLVIAAVCSGLVGFVNEITKEPIARQEKLNKENAMSEVLSAAKEYESIELSEDGMIKEVYLGLDGSDAVGYTVTVAPKGYADLIYVMVGINMDYQVEGIKILNHSETPGLGANATDDSFTDQFKSKNKINIVKSNPSDDDVLAITGATITSDAIAQGVNEALEYVVDMGGVQ